MSLRRIAEKFLERGYWCIENTLTGNPQMPTLRFEFMTELRIDDCEEYHARFLTNVLNHSLELTLAANKSVEVVLDVYAFELGCRRFDDRIERLSGRVRNEIR